MNTAFTDFFNASAIAVVGASTHPEKVGHQVLRNLIDKKTRSRRRLYPIHPTAKTILGLRAYPTLTAVTEPIDLVVIATPAVTVLGIIDQLIERNRSFPTKQRVRAVVIISAGFAEENAAGKKMQHVIATKLLLAKIRLLGPNTLGFIFPRLGLNVSFAKHLIPAGNLALISQSGAMMTALFDAFEHRQVGVSFAVSLGNKADVNENDALRFALHDPETAVIVLYLESFSNLPQFFEITSLIAAKKPILFLKGGTSERGQAASASHTAALATNQVLLAAAATQMGFTLVDTIEELLNAAFFLAAHRQAPENTMVITNAGGPAVNTIDRLAATGVQLAQWTPLSKTSLADRLPKIKAHNPLDLLGDAQPKDVTTAIEIAQRDLNIESILLIITPQAVTDMNGIVDACINARGRKPLLVSLMGGDHLEPLRRRLREHEISCQAFPNDLVELLAIMQRSCLARTSAQFFASSQPHAVTTILPKRQPTLAQAFDMLKQAGFSIPPYTIVTSASPAALETLKYPVFAKTANMSLLHKAKIGAVYGMVADIVEAKKAYQHLKQFGNAVLFQAVIDVEHELLLGVQNDPQFGLFLTIGLGGSYTNVIADRGYAFLPTTASTLKKTWGKTKAAQVIRSTRPECEAEILRSMQNLQKLSMRHPELKTLEINPLVVNASGIWAADIKVGV